MMKGLRKGRHPREWLTTHGAYRTLLYQVWCGMKQRCSYPKHKNYSSYGGRGIVVCQAWQESFAVFQAWAESTGYKKGLILDREDNDKNYEPGNCRWVSTFNSCANKRNPTLSIADAQVVKDLAWRGVQYSVIAALYGIGEAYVSAVKLGYAWKKLPSPMEVQ